MYVVVVCSGGSSGLGVCMLCMFLDPHYRLNYHFALPWLLSWFSWLLSGDRQHSALQATVMIGITWHTFIRKTNICIGIQIFAPETRNINANNHLCSYFSSMSRIFSVWHCRDALPVCYQPRSLRPFCTFAWLIPFRPEFRDIITYFLRWNYFWMYHKLFRNCKMRREF